MEDKNPASAGFFIACAALWIRAHVMAEFGLEQGTRQYEGVDVIGGQGRGG